MMEILGIVLASIVAVILIMALIGYFMEKNQNKKGRNSASLVSPVTNISQVNNVPGNNIPVNNIPVNNNPINNETVVSTSEIKENENSVVNENVPTVLNFNEISNDLEKKENNNFNVQNNI